MEVLSLCPFRAGALAWQSAPNAWSLTVVVKATFTIVPGGEATLAPVQVPVAAFAGDTEGSTEDLSPLKPRVDVLVLRGRNEDTSTVEIASAVLPARGPMPPYAPMRRLLLQDQGLEWAGAVLRGDASIAGPAPEGFDFSFFHSAPKEQRIDLLRTGVPIVLNNVLSSQARVETILPQRKPQAFRIHPQTGKASEIILRGDTLCIDAGRNLLILTFRGLADIDAGGIGSVGTIVVAAHSAGKKIRADRIERFLRNGDPIEGESNDGRHPLEKRYDTVLAAPKGDTVALPELEGSGGWPAAGTIQNESTAPLPGAPPALPFQQSRSDAPPPLIPPAPLNRPPGGRRHGTLSLADAARSPDLPFQGTLPPPVAEEYEPPPPPEGVFPAPPALLGGAPAVEYPPLIRRPAMLGSLTRDEKTADLPPGQAPTPENADDATVDFPPDVAATVRPVNVTPPPVEPPAKKIPAASSLAGKPASAPKAPIAAPSAPKPLGVIGAPKAPTPAASKPVAPIASAPKPAATAISSPKPAAVTTTPKPAVSPAVAPKPIAPKGPIKVPAPLGPKLKTDAAVKPAAIAPAINKKSVTPAVAKPAMAAPEKPAMLAPEKPLMVTPEKPAMLAPEQPVMGTPEKPAMLAKPAPMRPTMPTVLFPGKIAPDDDPSAKMESFDAAKALKLQECAALEAEIRHRPANRKILLEQYQLSDEQWLAVKKHWADAIARQTEVGERKLLLAYDAAYFAVQERLGIKVGLETHAKLQVAAERGTSPEILKECGLEPADQMRLGRVWTQRLADEPARMKELAVAIEKARAG